MTTTDLRHADFWSAACRAVPDLPPGAEYQVWYFGDSERLARELADLALNGARRATAGLLRVAENDSNAMPVLGGCSIVTDRTGAPLLIIRTADVEIRPYRSADSDFAAAEGEGDGPLAYWRSVHWGYFSRRCQALGRAPSEDMPIVLERFALVHPVGK